MNKKLISMLTVFATITLFSIGFATWGIIEGTAFKSTETEDKDVSGDDIHSIIDIGVSYDLDSYPVESFIYYQDVTNNTNKFSSTDIKFTFIANKEVFETLEYDNSDIYYLQVELYYDSNEYDLFTSSTYITSPSSTTIYLYDMENVMMSSSISSSKISINGVVRYSLTTLIPVKSSTEKSLYDLVFMNNYSNEVPITICYQFTNPNDSSITSTVFEAFKNIQFNFMLTVSEL